MWDMGDCPILLHSVKYMCISENEGDSSMAFPEGDVLTEIDTIFNRFSMNTHICINDIHKCKMYNYKYTYLNAYICEYVHTPYTGNYGGMLLRKLKLRIFSVEYERVT